MRKQGRYRKQHSNLFILYLLFFGVVVVDVFLFVEVDGNDEVRDYSNKDVKSSKLKVTPYNTQGGVYIAIKLALCKADVPLNCQSGAGYSKHG